MVEHHNIKHFTQNETIISNKIYCHAANNIKLSGLSSSGQS